jgi:hypothetical protein
MPMATTFVAVPARLGEMDISKTVAGVADSIVDAMPDRQAAERVVESLAATVAAKTGRRKSGGIGHFVRSHPKLTVGVLALLLAGVTMTLVKRSRRRSASVEQLDVARAA